MSAGHFYRSSYYIVWHMVLAYFECCVQFGLRPYLIIVKYTDSTLLQIGQLHIQRCLGFEMT